jgi:lipase maturation factor
VDDVDIRARTPLDWLAGLVGPPRNYVLVRWLILRLLGVVYLFAFLGVLFQGPALLGEHGLTPLDRYFDQLRTADQTFWDVPSVLWLDHSDGALTAWAIVGIALSVVLLAGYANLPLLAVLWIIYGSIARVGQLWFSFGWEIQLLETTTIAAVLACPWDPRPLRARPPPLVAIVLMRWLVFRIMIGAGLIKLRGDDCWSNLTCLDAHFETQPNPNPLSAWFHHLPHGAHAFGVLFNHYVEVVLPFCVFGPRVARLYAGVMMAAFQIALILSGNLAFLNWLTLVPILALFDDDFVLRLIPNRLRAWLRARLPEPRARDPMQLAIVFGAGLLGVVLWNPLFGSLGNTSEVMLALVFLASIAAAIVRYQEYLVGRGFSLDGHQLAVGAFAALVALKSCSVVDNLASKRQAMNRSYDRLALVNTYGAFGSVTMERHELIVEGTRDSDPTTATWQVYEFPCKPGDLTRRPCVLGPYHMRLDWLIWFEAMAEGPSDPWILHFVWKLLDGDPGIRTLLATDPFDGAPPTYVRIRRFVYHLQPLGADTWWTRDEPSEELWLPPMARDSCYLLDVLVEYGWLHCDGIRQLEEPDRCDCHAPRR